MVARIDPRRRMRYPELIPESIATTASASGTSVASYSSFEPYTLFLKDIFTGQTPSVTLRVDNDGGHGVLESPLVSRPGRMDRLGVPNEIPCYDSLDLWMIGSVLPTFCAYTLKITKLSVFEKYKLGLSLDAHELDLLKQFDVVKRYKAGLLRPAEYQSQFKKVVEVSRTVTVAAGANGHTNVGKIVQVKRGEKAVLLGVAVDTGMVQVQNRGPGVNDTFLRLDRDVSDTRHFDLDCACMPSIDTEIPCYIPALDKHDIYLTSTTGVTSLPVRYRYGVSDLTLIEKIRWNVSLTTDEVSIATELDLIDSVDAGVF